MDIDVVGLGVYDGVVGSGVGSGVANMSVGAGENKEGASVGKIGQYSYKGSSNSI